MAQQVYDSVVSLYSKTGKALARPRLTAVRAWTLNEANQGQLIMPTNDPSFSQVNLQFGNLVMIQHPRLPDWGGVLYTPRAWDTGYVDCQLYSAEKILQWRRGPGSVTLTGSPGDIFSQLINLANSRAPTPIDLGDVYSGGDTIAITVSSPTIYDCITELSKQTGEDWRVIPIINPDGSLSFKANWYHRQGTVRAMKLEEGHNMEKGSRPLVEQGDIINDLEAIGQDANFQVRPSVIIEDQDSKNTYGVIEGSQTFQASADSLPSIGYVIIQGAKNPRRTFTVSALDVSDTFLNIDLGDRIPLKLNSVGFTNEVIGIETVIRIIGMGFDDEKGSMDLVCDEYTDVTTE